MHRLMADDEKVKSTFVKNSMLIEYLESNYCESVSENKLEQSILGPFGIFSYGDSQGYAPVDFLSDRLYGRSVQHLVASLPFV